MQLTTSTDNFADATCQAEDGLLDLVPKLLHDTPANFTYLFLADYL